MTIPIVSYTPPSGTALGGFPLRADPYTDITPFTYRDGLTYLETLEQLTDYINTSIIPYVDANYTALQGAWDTEVADIVNSVNAAIDSQLSGTTVSITNLVNSVNALTPQITAAVTAAGASATAAAGSATNAATSATAASTSASAASTSATAAAASVTSATAAATTAAGSATAAATSATASASSATAAAASAASAGSVNGAQVVKAGMTAANNRSKLHYIASADAARSRGNARVPFDDSAQFDELWANLTNWSANTLAVSGGRLVGNSGVNNCNRGITLATGEEFRMKTDINLVAGGASTALILVGVDSDASGVQPVVGNVVAIGIRGDGYVISWRGANVGGTSAAVVMSPAPLAVGKYYVTVVVDANTISCALSSVDGLTLYEYSLPRNTLTAINNAFLCDGDTRGATGVTIGPVHWRRAITWVKPRVGIEGFAPEVNLVQDANAQLMRVCVPANYDPRVPAPLILMTHGAGRDQSQMSTTTAQQALLASFLSAGYIVASHNQHGSNWGAPVANDDMVALYQWVIKRYAITGAPFIWTHSMGALSALNLISTQRLPCAAIGIVDGVFNLGYQFTQNWNGTEQAQIIAGWGMAVNGSNYGTMTAGYDPLINAQNDPSQFRGVPMLITSSAGDTHVPEQYNAQAFEALITGYNTFTHVEHTGNHGDDTGFLNPNFVGFFNKYQTVV